MNPETRGRYVAEVLECGRSETKLLDHCFFGRAMKVLIQRANELAKSKGAPEDSYWCDNEFIVGAKTYRAGIEMEITEKMLTKVTDDIQEANKLLQRVANDLTTTYELLLPHFSKLVKEIRSHRMVIANESRQMVQSLSDVRKFFLDKDHQHEIQRLKEFMDLAKELKRLVDDGTVELITDAILKLEVGENGRKKEEYKS